MKKYVVEVCEGQKLTAGSKAKEDVIKFLNEDEFETISISVPKK